MTREIDILEAAVRNGFTIVEKETHVVWDEADLAHLELSEPLAGDDALRPADDQADVGNPFPGCVQQMGRGVDLDRCELLGQTQHFLIFIPPRQTDRV